MGRGRKKHFPLFISFPNAGESQCLLPSPIPGRVKSSSFLHSKWTSVFRPFFAQESRTPEVQQEKPDSTGEASYTASFQEALDAPRTQWLQCVCAGVGVMMNHLSLLRIHLLGCIRFVGSASELCLDLLCRIFVPYLYSSWRCAWQLALSREPSIWQVPVPMNLQLKSQ